MERLIGSARRECLDHVLVLGEPHLHHILTGYFAYYHGARTHLALEKDALGGQPVVPAAVGPAAARCDAGRYCRFRLRATSHRTSDYSSRGTVNVRQSRGVESILPGREGETLFAKNRSFGEPIFLAQGGREGQRPPAAHLDHHRRHTENQYIRIVGERRYWARLGQPVRPEH